ncbi:MAG: hypothetical protein V4629_00090 [Pseudomonadota bacterium]
MTASIYWVGCIWFDHTQPGYWSYFDHLAAAFLDGRMYLTDPAITQDLTLYQQRWYVPFPPMPSILMLPWIALLGIEHFNSIIFSVIIGGINTGLIFLLLASLSQKKLISLSLFDNLWLTLFFGFGTVHWYMSTVGTVWFIAQICTFSFLSLATLFTVNRYSPWWIGSALGMAIAARPHVILMWPLLFGIQLYYQKSYLTRSHFGIMGWIIRLSAPVAISILLLLFYNYIRFDNFLDFGYKTQNVADWVKDNLNQYGQFNPYFISKNFWAMWLATPEWMPDLKQWQVNAEGMSILLTSPLFIFLIRVFQKININYFFVISGALLALLLISGILLLYYNTGWRQFGYRFSLDYMIPLFILMSFSAHERVTCGMRLLILFSIQINAYGVYWWHTN